MNELIQNFLRWYYKKDVVPTLQAMQKMIGFYYDKDINMLELGCTLPNWPIFAYTNLLMQNTKPSRKEIKTS